MAKKCRLKDFFRICLGEIKGQWPSNSPRPPFTSRYFYRCFYVSFAFWCFELSYANRFAFSITRQSAARIHIFSHYIFCGRNHSIRLFSAALAIPASQPQKCPCKIFFCLKYIFNLEERLAQHWQSRRSRSGQAGGLLPITSKSLSSPFRVSVCCKQMLTRLAYSFKASGISRALKELNIKLKKI